MARTLNNLSARHVETLAKPGRHSDGGGLYLVVTPAGRRNWAFMYTRHGKRTEMGLGQAGRGGVSLSAARDLAQQCRESLRCGKDPLATRRQDHQTAATIPTFADYADAYVKAKGTEWRNAKHRAQWEMTLTNYCTKIRRKTVDSIDTADILEVLRPIWGEKPETASRLRGRIENVLDAAKAEGLRTGENPARWRGHLDKLLPRRQRLTRGHHAALPYADVPAFMEGLRDHEATGALALQFLILTVARTGEVLGATWDEIDMDKALWTVPAGRMKAGHTHRVPLSEPALAILRKMAADKPDSDDQQGAYVFPGARAGRPISNMTMSMFLRRNDDRKFTVHGFRSAFRDWVGEETDFRREIAEAALAHVVGDSTERAYRRGDALEKRRELMEAWSDYAESRTG